ncbi:cytochrome o ubiquinol oxidase subunit III [Pokkaliibacter sp. CJK22405]|uniref:cytochrome o ubiquinol oxidase subunit III n=1 Tax=Pokkaliibacter sp. CJK22405 TaxID=3384615 RepID=UPI00398486D8
MSSQAMHHDAHGDHGHHDAGAMKVFGFWIYIMTDLIIFATLFATYAVLHTHVADGPDGKEIFELPFVLVETFLLLISSFTSGLAMLAMHKGNKAGVVNWLIVTALLGMGFVGMEVYEFHHLILEGFGPDKSAFLSSFFTLVGTHGLHVTCGILWMLLLIFQISKKGLTDTNNTRLQCLSLFWHFLDIVWICVFTVVYLMGAM